MDWRSKTPRRNEVELHSYADSTGATVEVEQSMLPAHRTPPVTQAIPNKNLALDFWQSPYLKKSAGISFAALILIFAVALEIVLRELRSRHGISTQSRSAVLAVKHVPTVVVILLGLYWRLVVRDLKRLMPWARLSRGRWTATSESLLINYIDGFDFVSCVTAVKHRDWAICLGLGGALTLGAMVPLSNALTYEALQLDIEGTSISTVASTFTYGTRILPAPGYSSVLPFQAVAFASFTNSANSTYPPWSKDTYAFESFDIPAFVGDGTAKAKTTAFSAGLHCTSFEYKPDFVEEGVNGSFHLSMYPDDQTRAGCRAVIDQSLKVPFNTSNFGPSWYIGTGGYNPTPFAWTNVTTCSNSSDWRMLINMLSTKSNMTTTHTDATLRLRVDRNATASVASHGQLCQPYFESMPAEVVVNTTTGIVLSYSLNSSDAHPIDLGLSTLLVHALFQNPFSVASQAVFDAASPDYLSAAENVYDWSQFPQYSVMQKHVWLYMWRSLQRNYTDGPIDAVFSSANNQSSQVLYDMWEDTDLMLRVIDHYFGQVMAQYVSIFGRIRPSSKQVSMIYRYREDRQLGQEAMIRTLQGLTVVLATASILVVTVFRPYLSTYEDPSTLAFAALLLANSPAVEEVAFRRAVSSAYNPSYSESVAAQYRLSKGLERIRLEIQAKPLPEPDRETARFDHLLNTDESIEMSALESSAADTPRKRLYKPFSLRASWRVFVLSCITTLILALALTLYLSHANNYFTANRDLLRALYTYVPTLVLVLVAYSIMSTISTVEVLESFSVLLQNQSQGSSSMFHPAQSLYGWCSIFMSRSPGKRIRVVIMWFLLSTPAMKILVAGLFNPVYRETIPFTVSTNMNFVRNFDQSIVKSREWTWTDIGVNAKVAYNLHHQLNKVSSGQSLDNLILPILTENPTARLRGPRSARHFTVRSGALRVESNCLHKTDFELKMNCSESSSPIFYFECSSEECHSDFEYEFSIANYSYPATSWWVQPTDIPKPGPSYFTTASSIAYSGQYNVIAANFSALNQDDVMKVGCDADRTTVNGSMLQVDLPSILAIRCDRTYSEVMVNVTYTRPDSGTNIATDNARDTLLPYFHDWVPTSYDKQSITHIRDIPYNISSDYSSMYAPIIESTVYPQMVYAHRPTVWNRLWRYDMPSLTIAALQANNQSENDFYDADALIQASQRVLNDYTVNNLLQFAKDGQFNMSADNMTTSGVIHTDLEVMQQDIGTTAALLTLLVLCTIAFVYTFAVVPTHGFLERAPSSILERLSLLAGSQIVRDLREEEPVVTKHSATWLQNFGLGWWPYDQNCDSRLQRSSGFRWGIDIGAIGKPGRETKRPPSEVSTVSATSTAPLLDITR